LFDNQHHNKLSVFGTLCQHYSCQRFGPVTYTGLANHFCKRVCIPLTTIWVR